MRARVSVGASQSTGFCSSPLEVSYDYKSVAGLRKLVALGLIKRDELAVAFITGAGLKTQGVVAEGIHPLVIQRTLEPFEEVFGK